MSTTVENQVVSMQFDNKHFESNVKTSMSTLEKLKQSLKLQDAAKGFSNVSAAAKKVNLNPISGACEAVGLKFNALYTIADQAMRNITNSVQRTATNIARSFTLDPIKTGFQEYETQINAVQTILANTQSKGTTLDDVNSALDTLNTYADKTIYNFTEMTRNIGTFTAAGVDLDTSVNAIQGIANLAAISGSNSQQASTAMYQLSQALASGTVKLMDWNSVVNAGMGGQVFQDALKETARVHGVAIDDMIKDQGSFRETLSEGWLTSEILTETLMKFTMTTEGLTDAQIEQNRTMLKGLGYTDEQIDGIFELGQTATDAATKVKTFTQLMDTLKESAQSGWTQTWEILIGDFEEAKNLWTTVSEVFGDFINKSSEKRNNLLSGALDNSGWDNFIGKVEDAGIKVTDFEAAVKEAAKKHNIDVDEMIKDYGSLEKAVQKGKIGVDILKEALNSCFGTKGQKDFEEYTVKAGDTLSELAKKWNTSVEEIALLNKIDNPDMILTGQIIKIPKAIEKTGEAAKSAEGDVESFAEALAHVQEKGGKELLHESIANAWKGLTTILGEVGKAWRGVFPPMQSKQLFNIIEGIHAFSENLVVGEGTAAKLGRTLKGVFATFGIIADLIGGGLKFAFNLLTKILGKFDLNILDVTAGIGDAMVFLRDNIDKGIDAIADWMVKIYELPAVQSAITKVKETFNKFLGPVTDGFKNFINLIKNPFTVDENGEKRLISLSEVFENFKTNIVDKFKKIDFSALFSDLGNSVANIGTTIKAKFAEIGVDFEEVGSKISSFFEKIGKVVSENKGKIIAIGALIGVFLTIKKVASVVEIFTSPFQFLDQLGDTIQSFGAAAKASAVKSIAVSIGILAASLALLAMLPYGKLWSAVGALVVITAALVGAFAALSLAAKKLGDVGDITKVALSIMALAGALLLFGIAAKMIGSLDWGALLKTAVVLAGFTIGLKAIAKSATGANGGAMIGFGKMLIQLGAALLLFAVAVAIFGNMDTSTLIKGGASVMVFLMAMVGVMKATQLLAKADKGQSFAKVGGTLLAMSASLLLIAASVAILGNMDTSTLIKGGAAVLVFMIAMVGVMKATQHITKLGRGESIVKIGGIFAALGAALLMIAASVAIFGNMDTGTLLKGGATIMVFLGAMVGVMKATQLLAKTSSGESFAKVSGTILAMSAAMLILSGSLALLSLIKPADLLKGTLAIGALGVVMMGLMTTAQTLPAEGAGKVIALAAAVAILAGSLIALTFVDPKALATAAVCLGGITGMFALLSLSSKSVSMKSAASLGVMAIVVAGLAGIIYLLKDLPADQAIGVSGAISMLIASLSASLLMISVATNKGKISLKGIGMMALALAAIGAVAGIFAAIGVAALPTIGAKLAAFFEELSPFLQSVKDIDPGVLKAIGTLTSAMAALAAGAAAFAIVDAIPGIDAGASFGVFIGWIKEMLPVVKDFATELSGAGVDINAANLDAVIGAVKTLAEAAASAPSITVAAGGFGSKWGGGGGAVVSVPQLTAVKNWIMGVAPVVKDLALGVSAEGVKINTTGLTAVMDAANSLAEAAALAPSATVAGGAFTSKWVNGGGGVIDWPLLGAAKDWIVGVTPSIQALAESLSGGNATKLDTKALTAVCEGAKILAESAALAPSTEVMAGFAKGPWGMAGAISLDIPMMNTAANWIAKAKGPVIQLAKAVSKGEIPDFSADNLKSVVNAVKTLCEAGAAAPTVDVTIAGGGSQLLGFFAGAKVTAPMIGSITDFVSSIGTPITTLASTVAGIDMTSLDIDKFNAIVGAVKDIASADYPELDIAIGGAGGAWGGAGALATSIPMVSSVTSFIKGVKQPIIDLANEVSTGLTTDFNVENFKAITQAVVDISSAQFPEFTAVGVGVVTPVGVIAGCGFSAADLLGVKNFIVGVKQPIIDLANAVSTGLTTDFDVDNFKAMVQAIVDISSAQFPPLTNIEASMSNAFAICKAEAVGFSGADLEGVKNFIVEVKQPIIDLANAISGENAIEFDSEKFKTVVGAIVDLASAEYPGIESMDFNAISTLGAMKLTAQQKTDFKGFTQFIMDVKDPIKDLSIAVSGEDVSIDDDKISSVVDAVRTLAEASSAIPTEGGVTNWWTGNTDFAGFATFIGGLAEPLTALTTDLSEATINPTKIEAATEALGTLARASNYIPEEGGVEGWWSGETGWENFTSNLEAFGEGMSAFSEKVKGIDPNAVAAASQAINYIADSAQMLVGIGGNTWQSGYAIEGLDQLLKGYSDPIVNFSEAVQGINVEAVSTAMKTISGVADTFLVLEKYDYDSVDFEAFGSKCSELTSAMQTFSENASAIDPSGAIANVNSLVDMLSNVSSANMTGATSFQEALAGVASTSITDFTNAFSDATAVSTASNAGKTLMDSVASGITSNESVIKDAAEEAAGSGSSAIGTGVNYQAYYSAGAYVGAGFAAGISSMLGEAAAAGTSLGNAALEAAKAALDENSPSKEFYKVGEFAGIGLVNALYEYERATYKAGYGVGESAKFGLGDAISTVSDIIENGVDTQPTIRPVMDLTDISTGTERMNRMLSMQPAVGVSAKLKDISTSMADRGQNGNNDDVIAAIKGLGSKISESGRDTYNINGITYDDGSNITGMVKALTRAIVVEGRV